MMKYCGLGLLPVLATLAMGDEPAATSGDAYRARARAAIQDVLARREFADLHSDPYSLWRQVLAWIADLFQRLTGALHGLPTGTFWTVVALMLLALLAIIAHLIYTLATLLAGTDRATRGTSGGDRITGELLGIQDLDFDKVYAEARRLLAAGDWPAATRHFYVAAILWLNNQGWIAFKRSKTNGDYLAELARGAGVPALAGFSGKLPPQGGAPPPAALPPAGRGSPTAREHAFRRLTELFEPVVYGGRQPTASIMNDISSTVEGLLHEPAVVSPR